MKIGQFLNRFAWWMVMTTTWWTILTPWVVSALPDFASRYLPAVAIMLLGAAKMDKKEWFTGNECRE